MLSQPDVLPTKIRREYGRKTFAAYYDVSQKTDISEEVTFPDFVQLIVNGPKELAEFIDQNQLEGQSLGIDTGMVDAKGQSAKWDSYWHRCGLCNPGFKPHYILHFEHYPQDEEVSDFQTRNLALLLTTWSSISKSNDGWRCPHSGLIMTVG